MSKRKFDSSDEYSSESSDSDYDDEKDNDELNDYCFMFACCYTKYFDITRLVYLQIVIKSLLICQFLRSIVIHKF